MQRRQWCCACTLKTPSTHSRVFSKTDFFLRMRLPSIRNQRFRAPKTEVSKYALQGGHFENRDSSHSCGRAKTEVFKYDDVMPRFKARSSAHTIRKRYVWTQIFLNTEKKISVFKNTRLRVDCQIRFINATCGRAFF